MEGANRKQASRHQPDVSVQSESEHQTYNLPSQRYPNVTEPIQTRRPPVPRLRIRKRRSHPQTLRRRQRHLNLGSGLGMPMENTTTHRVWYVPRSPCNMQKTRCVCVLNTSLSLSLAVMAMTVSADCTFALTVSADHSVVRYSLLVRIPQCSTTYPK